MQGVCFNSVIMRPIFDKNNQTPLPKSAYGIVKLSQNNNILEFCTVNCFNAFLPFAKTFRLVVCDSTNQAHIFLIDPSKKVERFKLLNSPAFPLAFALVVCNGVTESSINGEKGEQTFTLALFGKENKCLITTQKLLKIYESTVKQAQNDNFEKEKFVATKKALGDSYESQKSLSDKNNQITEREKEYNSAKNSPIQPYDDEAIASENYFELFEKEQNESLSNKTDLPNRQFEQGQEKEKISARPSGYKNAPCESQKHYDAKSCNPKEQTHGENNEFIADKSESENNEFASSKSHLFSDRTTDKNFTFNNGEFASENCAYKKSPPFNDDAQINKNHSLNKNAKANENAIENENAQAKECENLSPKFYDSIKDKIEGLFKKHPAFKPLNELIDRGKWIKIAYTERDFYIVGIIEKDGEVEYIAYGVAGDKNKRPKGFESYGIFIPESVYLKEERGYWCILQRATDGSTLTPPT